MLKCTRLISADAIGGTGDAARRGAGGRRRPSGATPRLLLIRAIIQGVFWPDLATGIPTTPLDKKLRNVTHQNKFYKESPITIVSPTFDG